MESEVKIGQQFEFAIHADKGLRQKAVVTRVLSNREKGIGPEADYYIAAWIEARTLSEQPKALVFVLANDGNVYLDGQGVDIMASLRFCTVNASPVGPGRNAFCFLLGRLWALPLMR